MRLEHLDGLRGVAILLVIFFHAYSRWPNIVPYGEAYAQFPLFEFGWVGVQLFFMISGYVIFMSLDKASGFRFFILNRWLRLFPAMLVATILVYTTASFFHERPMGQPVLIGVLPGLTFIDPGWWAKILGFQFEPIEGVFWSLYVEFKFYCISGLIYFSAGRKYLIVGLVLLFFTAVTLNHAFILKDIDALYFVRKICSGFSLQYFGWFSIGAIFYVFNQDKNPAWIIYASLVAIISSIAIRSSYDENAFFSGLLIYLIFLGAMLSGYVQSIFKIRGFLFFGYISYPLYLIHENAMISIIVKLSAIKLSVSHFFYPIIALIFISAISYCIANYMEPKIRALIIESIRKIKLAYWVYKSP